MVEFIAAVNMDINKIRNIAEAIDDKLVKQQYADVDYLVMVLLDQVRAACADVDELEKAAIRRKDGD